LFQFGGADTVRRIHISNLVIRASGTDIAILNRPDRLAEPVSFNLLRAQGAQISTNASEKHYDCGRINDTELLHDGRLMLISCRVSILLLQMLGMGVPDRAVCEYICPQTAVNVSERASGVNKVTVMTVASIELLNRDRRRDI
jgi:hypothetical protein